jgi:hypothetical protein
MTKPTVLITAIESDWSIAGDLQRQFRASDISCRLLSIDESADDLHHIIAQIEDVITSFGVMVVVLSKKSAFDHRIISNAQYACELAKRRAVLVIYQIEEVPLDNPLELYYSQSILVKKTKKATYQKVVNNIKRLLDHSKAPAAFRPRRLSPKAVKRLAIGGSIIGLLFGVGSVLWSRFITTAEAPQPAVSTPVVFENPYSEESLDQDFVPDVRSAPDYKIEGDLELDAPFHFQPEFIHKIISFDDPTHDGLIENTVIEYASPLITRYDKLFLQQSDGLLQLSIAPQEVTSPGRSFPIKYAFSSNELNYLGIRIKVMPYSGWLNAGDEISLYIDANSNGSKGYAQLVKIDLIQQQIEVPEPVDNDLIPCKAGWHALEFLSDDQSDKYNLYLDGVLIGKTDPLEPNQYWGLNLVVDQPAITNWVSLFLDEIVFGGKQPLHQAEDPDEVSYAITPDEITYKTTFESGVPGDYLRTSQTVWVEDDILKFNAEGNGDAYLEFPFPIGPITETNYASMKYRFTDTSSEYWARWGGAIISMENHSSSEENWPVLSVEVMQYHPEFIIYNIENMEGAFASEENLGLGKWHTMEMVIEPVTVGMDQYFLKFWHDGIFVAEIEISPIEDFLNSENNLICRFTLYSDDNRQGTFAGEVSELTVGFIAFPELSEE